MAIQKIKRLDFDRAHKIAVLMHGDKLGMFARLMTKGGNTISGKYISYGLNRIITRAELLNFCDTQVCHRI